MNYLSTRVNAALASSSLFYRFMSESAYARLHHDPEVCNFVFGNPQEMPQEELVSSLKHWITPQNKDWFAYKDSVESATSAVALSLQKRLNLDFAKEDITMTTGAFAGLSISLAALVNPGQEVIYHSPPWFFYESLIHTWGAQPVKINIMPDTFDLDLDALAQAITPRTRAVIINSPHNPTGKIYSAATLKNLTALLSDASKRIGHPIFIISDESYCRIVFDNRACPSPSQFYPYTLLVYTFGKTLLIPGQRIGYVALAPSLPSREGMRLGLMVAAANAGYVFPNALMQYALPDLENMSVDIKALQKRRDRIVSELSGMGYEVTCPEATFYVLVRSPISDDQAFCERLARHKILCLPGEVFLMPGFFRISLTASDTMVEKSLPGFRAACSA